MAKIYNSDVTKGLANNAGIQQNVDKTPNELAEKIVPTFETNPELLRKSNVVKSNFLLDATSATIFTTSAINDTYITGYTFSFRKDALATSSNYELRCIINGASTVIANLRGITLTAQSDNISFSTNYPIKIDKNTAVTLTSDTNVSAIRVYGVVFGYEIESRA